MTHHGVRYLPPYRPFLNSYDEVFFTNEKFTVSIVMVHGFDRHGSRFRSSWFTVSIVMVHGFDRHGSRFRSSWFTVSIVMVHGFDRHVSRFRSSWFTVLTAKPVASKVDHLKLGYGYTVKHG
ncbi:hypothetical protein RF11_10341 [Thelohanellus kitauei]|uniref:Uncharacterized protein n=1 Tax=Thelohanellus kitauei TaxID=669202 RepID=A0A0C2N531_THEKT|nr:hypothetical protein RF11_10341 [Thelohanellus kitauei]